MLYKLSGVSPVAEGGERYVYLHPHDDKLLIKVWKDRYYETLLKRYPFIHRLCRAPRYSSLTNEVIEHIVARENENVSPHLQNIGGFCDTDMGLGIVVEAVMSVDGNLAPTLGTLLDEKKFSNFHHREIIKLNSWLLNSKVIIRDLSLNNIVWDEVGGKFVIIDGVGAKPVPSLRKVFAFYNKRANKNRAIKLMKRISQKM